VPYYWVVDPDSRAIDAYVLGEGVYRSAARREDDRPLALPPFPDLMLNPADLWA